ncbi:ribosomal protein L15 [Actinidia rufa]|uniref:Ribosomal protein L15 n=1 Tax=Actinidia rufa TaxID=165716 RepID=A0A7J0DX47_9ERIC|nr:ribosomal protein L15 [Actinidia rufa]
MASLLSLHSISTAPTRPSVTLQLLSSPFKGNADNLKTNPFSAPSVKIQQKTKLGNKPLVVVCKASPSPSASPGKEGVVGLGNWDEGSEIEVRCRSEKGLRRWVDAALSSASEIARHCWRILAIDNKISRNKQCFLKTRPMSEPERSPGMSTGLPKFIPVNLKDIEAAGFEEGEEVSLESLKMRGLINPSRRERTLPLKILGDGELSATLSFKARAFSEAAKEKLEAAGCSLTVLPGRKKWVKPSVAKNLARAKEYFAKKRATAASVDQPSA